MRFETPDNLLSLRDILKPMPDPGLPPILIDFTERLLRLKTVESLYRDCSGIRGHQAFLNRVSERLNIRYRVDRGNLDPSSRKGPAIVVSNHPFGGIDAILIALILLEIRSDVKILANRVLLRIPELRDLIIGVDPFGGAGSKARNTSPLREAARWVNQGGMLMLFPAGEVSSFRLEAGEVTDSEWHRLLGWLVESTGAPVIPAYFHGRNSLLFQGLGLLHPALRTALLPHELLNKKNRTFEIVLGSPVSPEVLRALGDRAKIVQYLRFRSESLKSLRSGDGRVPGIAGRFDGPKMPLAGPPATRLLRDEIEKLPKDRCLAEHGEFAVYCAKADQAPWLLQEIGRLRELTFRACGEGTGKPCDIDLYDAYYRHLVLWNRRKHEVVGAYRLGLTDEILKRFGKKGLYTQSLFHYKRPLLTALNPGIELGRSFIRAEYQSDYAPLLLLWKGIGRFVAKNPRYRKLFGPVSISSEYRSLSRQLLVDFLRWNRFDFELARYVKPRRPFKNRNPLASPYEDQDNLTDLGALSDRIAGIEPDGKGVPILVKHYLKLGGKFLGFNVDEKFSNVLDGLILVDLCRTDIRLLDKYMGPDNVRSFIEYHRRRRMDRSKIS